MSVTRWISQDVPGNTVDEFKKIPVKSKLASGRMGWWEFGRTYHDENTFQHDHPAAWAALNATRDDTGMAGPVEVEITIEPKEKL